MASGAFILYKCGKKYLVCLCNHLNLQTGFSDNLKHSSKIETS